MNGRERIRIKRQVDKILIKVYSEEGVMWWWTSRNPRLPGTSKHETIPGLLLARDPLKVLALAEELGKENA